MQAVVLEEPEGYDYMMKLILVGDPCRLWVTPGVGKSSLLMRFSQNYFVENHEATVGIEFSTKLVKFNEKIIKLQIWDSVGSKSSRQVRKTTNR